MFNVASLFRFRRLSFFSTVQRFLRGNMPVRREGVQINNYNLLLKNIPNRKSEIPNLSYLNCIALTGFTFLISNVGMISVATHMMKVMTSTSITCNQFILASALLI